MLAATLRINHRQLFALLMALLVALTLVACVNAGPVKRHAETEWGMRSHMPTFTPQQWNAWEAELAAALDEPEPDPPMFPEAAPPPDDESEPGSD